MKQFTKVNSDSSLSGVIRTIPEDFKVDEIAQFMASGSGEHVWLHIQKTGENTDWVAGLLSKIADVPRRDVSYAGMKDRHAVTTQWFSVQMPGREAPDWQKDLPESIVIQEEKRHDRKLKRGALEGNHFKITIKDFKGEKAELTDSVNRIIGQGVPNYFGEQRFGRDGENIRKAQQWFKGELKVKSRTKRSIYLSAARSWIFNHILSQRVEDETWNKALQGDVFMLDGSKSCFSDIVDTAITDRVKQQTLHPTGALWGRGELTSNDEISELENMISKQFSLLVEGLEKNGLKQERKSLRLAVKDFNCSHDVEQSEVILSFSLPAGAYATSVLSEIGSFSSISG